MLLARILPTAGWPLAARFDALDRETSAKLKATAARQVHGLHASLKTGCPVPFRTLAERDLAHLLETDSEVRSFAPWPEQVTVLLAGKPQSYVPAFRVAFRSGRTAVLDAVSAREEQDALRAELVGLVRRAYAERGVRYRALRHRQVLAEPRMANARRILAARGSGVPPATMLLVTRALSRGIGRRTVAEVERELAGAPGAPDAVFLMALQGRVDLDLSAPIPGDMVAVLRTAEGDR